MPRSIERLEDLILNGRIIIEDSPVTYACAANAALTFDGQKIVPLTKNAREDALTAW